MNFPLQQSFELYLDDDRYAVPTLRLIFAWDRAAAVEMAIGLLAESAHYRGAELCQDGEPLEGLGTLALRRLPPEVRAGVGALDS